MASCVLRGAERDVRPCHVRPVTRPGGRGRPAGRRDLRESSPPSARPSTPCGSLANSRSFTRRPRAPSELPHVFCATRYRSRWIAAKALAAAVLETGSLDWLSTALGETKRRTGLPGRPGQWRTAGAPQEPTAPLGMPRRRSGRTAGTSGDSRRGHGKTGAVVISPLPLADDLRACEVAVRALTVHQTERRPRRADVAGHACRGDGARSRT